MMILNLKTTKRVTAKGAILTMEINPVMSEVATVEANTHQTSMIKVSADIKGKSIDKIEVALMASKEDYTTKDTMEDSTTKDVMEDSTSKDAMVDSTTKDAKVDSTTRDAKVDIQVAADASLAEDGFHLH